MPGAYDVLSALLFEQMGFKAIQGTSGGIAAALGYPDGEVMSRDLFIETQRQLRCGGDACHSMPTAKEATAMKPACATPCARWWRAVSPA